MDHQDGEDTTKTEIWIKAELDSVHIIVQYVTNEGPEMIRIALDSDGAEHLASGILRARSEANKYMQEVFGVDSIGITTISEKE
jgi:hypothetical protein